GVLESASPALPVAQRRNGRELLRDEVTAPSRRDAAMLGFVEARERSEEQRLAHAVSPHERDALCRQAQLQPFEEDAPTGCTGCTGCMDGRVHDFDARSHDSSLFRSRAMSADGPWTRTRSPRSDAVLSRTRQRP